MTNKTASVEIISVSFAAGESRLFAVRGEYFELIDAVDPVDVILSDMYGAQRGLMRAALASFHLKNTEFSVVQITSATTQDVRFAYGTGEAGTRRTTGVVQLVGEQGAFAQASAVVTNASTQLLAANAARRYLLVQNNDAAGIVYVTLDGGAATTAKGIKIEPGGSYECAGYVPSGSIYAIGSIANNANVVTVEG